ncbi:hypothetical protein FGG78_28875 [Thioclava sp. BHET1]|nr:hypothetical protein FGG78_28875 [Thioclava sp. BHET1]
MVGQPHPGADLAIIFTATPPPGARHLLEVRFFPVCSPALFHEAGGLPLAQMLRPDLLLHLNNRSDWGAWLAEAGADPGFAGGGLHFSDLLALYAAAGAGLGLCLGDRITSDDALASGRLIRPYPQEIPARAGYWALPAQGGLTPPAAAFLDWLSAEMHQTAG